MYDYFARFLTLAVISAVLFAPTAFSQSDEVKAELSGLSSPAAFERAKAVSRLSKLPGDIDGDLRVAYKFGDTQERVGLLKAARIRGTQALLQHAVESLPGDGVVAGESHTYLLALPLKAMSPDKSVLDAQQLTAWNEFRDFRLKRDIADALIDAHLKPGKFFGQFEELRRLESTQLDAVLLRFVASDSDLVEALNLASTEIARTEPQDERSLQPAWRRLTIAAGAFDAPVRYHADAKLSDELQSLKKRTGAVAFLSGLEFVAGLRSAAARALADSPNKEALLHLLPLQYEATRKLKPQTDYVEYMRLEDLLVELEITLALFGDDTLFQARVGKLRAKVDRVVELKGNVNMHVSSRPDLLAQNEIAHLLLRIGNVSDAEAEWKAAITTAERMKTQVTGRNRSSLSSYLATVYYNQACAQTLQLKLSKGLTSLREAVDNGYRDFHWMLEDGDLDELRRTEEFRQWFFDVAPPAVADLLRDNS